ncbi:MAG: altronate dehydratase family protein [Elusimicrobiota bacterium]|jgi:altronate hydrolase|nr:altronate dehydratase family protein [Elusimicrobiota bacterium]
MERDNFFIKISEADNVVIALKSLKKGSKIYDKRMEIILLDDVEMGHKIACTAIDKNSPVIKYGEPIGIAKDNIKQGSWVHTHNLKTGLSGIKSYTYNKQPQKSIEIPQKFRGASFDGYKRKDGNVGVRNEIWIVPTVGCINTVAKILKERASAEIKANIDGIFAFAHTMGCSQIGDDMLMTQKFLAGLIKNPNAGGVLVLGLGCENNNIGAFEPFLGKYDKDRIKFLNIQSVDDEIAAGIKILRSLADYASCFKRENVGLENLVLGFKCGGSDAFSGIFANPLCGKINDIATALGAKTILTETPEMFGAEQLLMNRAADEKVFNEIVELINDFKKYFMKYGQTIYENPSPGNKDGGITTLEEKSLGCIQKGGTAEVCGVLNFKEGEIKSGLNLLSGPGNDMVSCSNLAANGAQILLFTTGRGTPFGSAVPTIKISSNSKLFEKKKHWIDFNAGVLNEGVSFQDASSDLFSYVLEIASGRVKTKNEINGYREIAIFKDGVIL